VSKTQEDIIEYARPNNKRTTDPNTLVLGGETPPNQDYLPPNNAFNWRDHKHFIVVQHQPAIAAYRDSDGSVCIRQEDIWGDGRDVTIYFTPEHAEKIANAIMALAERAE
jgi:hypothetical protein